MNTPLLLASAILLTALAPAVATAQESGEIPPKDPTTLPDTTSHPNTPPPAAASTALSPADRQFLDDAHASGQKEIHAARLARERSGDEDVQELAALIERDHSDLNARLASAGAQPVGGHDPSGVPDRDASAPPDVADAASQAQMARDKATRVDPAAALADDPHMKTLVDAQGTAFDRAYLDMLVKMHEQSIAKFEAVANGTGHSAAVKALAQEALPTLRRHAAMASGLDDALAQE